jgi:hypothetical protein
MSLAEILPAVRLLPREEKMELVRVLSAELLIPLTSEADRDRELLEQLVAAAPHQFHRPDFGPEAVAVLEELLANHRDPAG